MGYEQNVHHFHFLLKNQWFISAEWLGVDYGLDMHPSSQKNIGKFFVWLWTPPEKMLQEESELGGA
jgi:hypothetical protein